MKTDWETRRMKASSLANQPVTTGFIVKKRWKTEVPERDNPEKVALVPHMKVVSRPFLSRDAADIFKRAAEKDSLDNPIAGQLQVEFFVTENIGTDGLPKGL